MLQNVQSVLADTLLILAASVWLNAQLIQQQIQPLVFVPKMLPLLLTHVQRKLEVSAWQECTGPGWPLWLAQSTLPSSELSLFIFLHQSLASLSWEQPSNQPLRALEAERRTTSTKQPLSQTSIWTRKKKTTKRSPSPAKSQKDLKHDLAIPFET